MSVQNIMILQPLDDLDNREAQAISTSRSKKNPHLLQARELALELNLIWEQNARTVAGKGKGDPDHIQVSAMNTVTFLNIPQATTYLLNPMAATKFSIQRSDDSASSDPKEPDYTQVLTALPLGTVRSMAF